jgi:uncharacterized Tic20 family protein
MADEPEKLPRDVRTWAMLCHVFAFAGFFMPLVGNFLAPLILWLLKREEHPLLDDQGKESVNFQITMSMAMGAALILCIFLIGYFLLPALVVADIALTVVAAIEANEGHLYRYPFSLRLIG